MSPREGSRHSSRRASDSRDSRSSHRQEKLGYNSHGQHRSGGESDRFHREHYRDQNARDERSDRNHHGGRGYDRGYGHHQERFRRHNDRSPPSHSRNTSRNQSRSRSRSRSPSKSKRASGFDMAPPGANVASVAAAGQFPPVPQSTPAVMPNMLAFTTPQLGSLPLMPVQVMTQQATRHARRVYVGGLPPMANEQTIATFFSQVMVAIGGNAAGPGDAVVNVYINHEKKFAFVEMRTVEEASNAMALDGIIFEGVSVRVRRPTDYNPSLAATLGPSQPNPHLNLAAIGLVPGPIGGADGPDRIFVGGLPYYFTEAQTRELLESFGPLRGFDLVKDRETGNSKGYGFCIYQDPAVTDIACAALNGLKMGDKTLTVRRATASMQAKPEQELILQQAQQHIAMQKMVLQAGRATGMPGMDLEAVASIPTKVVCLTEVVSVDELRDDGEYEEILEDMKEESGKFGSLVTVVIPRPISGEDIPGVGKVFLEYTDIMGSARAKAALHGRKFGGNTVTAIYYPEDKFLIGDYAALSVA